MGDDQKTPYIVLKKQMFRWYTVLGCIKVGLFIKTAMYAYLLAYYHLRDLCSLGGIRFSKLTFYSEEK